MATDGNSSVAQIRALLDHLDHRIEAALTAQGFSFSALDHDEDGAEIRFDQADETLPWRLTFHLAAGGRPELELSLGGDAEPPVAALRLRVDGTVLTGLAPALAAAMAVVEALRQG
jgi:hypothetical protein